MSGDDTGLSPDFIEHQRERLQALCDQFLDTSAQADSEERDLGASHNEVQDLGDEGAIEARRHITERFSAEGKARLDEIRRALEKIAEGSYGLSDESGDPISPARLEAVPEARHTVEEAAERER